MGWRMVAATVLCAAGGLSGCGQETAPVQQQAADAIAVTDGRMVLNAVSGRPAAIYFNLANNSDKPITLRGVEVAGAGSAMMHSYQEWDGQMVMGEMAPLVVQPGGATRFEPGGQHVMAMDVASNVQAGGSTDVTLKLLGGGRRTFSISILAPGSVDETAPPLPARTPAPAS